jgi:hypothetical protein
VGFCLRFYQQTSIHSENRLKIWIPSPWDSYSILFRRFSVVHKFLGLLKNIKFWLKSQRGLVFGFTQKYVFAIKTSWKSVFLRCERHFLPRLDVKVLYMIFLGFEKYRDSAQNSKELVFDFTKKNICSPRKQAEISSTWGPYSVSVRCFGVVHKCVWVSKNIEFRLKT